MTDSSIIREVANSEINLDVASALLRKKDRKKISFMI